MRADGPPLVKFESKINLPCVNPQGLVRLCPFHLPQTSLFPPCVDAGVWGQQPAASGYGKLLKLRSSGVIVRVVLTV